METKASRGLAAAYRKNQSETVTLPSGSVALLRRPPLQIWASTGRFPQQILGAAIEAYQKTGNAEQAQADAAQSYAASPVEDKFALLKFMVDVVQYSFVEPRLVEGGTGDDELDPGEVSPEDFNFVFGWATRSNKDQVVGKRGLTVGAVETFRDGGRDTAAINAGGDLPVVPPTTAI